MNREVDPLKLSMVRAPASLPRNDSAQRFTIVIEYTPLGTGS